MTASPPPAPEPPRYPPPRFQHDQHYQDYQPPLKPPSGISVPRIVSAVLAILAAGLIVTGSFLPSVRTVFSVGGKRQSETVSTLWWRTIDPSPTGVDAGYYTSSHPAHYGIPLSAVAVALLAAAAFAIAARTTRASSRAQNLARTALAGAGAAAGAAVWMLGMDISSILSYDYERTGGGTADYAQRYFTGLGFWLTLGGGALAVTAALFGLLSTTAVAVSTVYTPPADFRAPPQSQYPPQRFGEPGPP